MPRRGTKRLCIRSAQHKGNSSASERKIFGIGATEGNCVALDWVPPENLKEIYKHCNLQTRSKLRRFGFFTELISTELNMRRLLIIYRVSHYWKYLVSLQEVNKVIIVNPQCCLVAPNQRRTAQNSHPRLIEGLNVDPVVQDGGLMGDHVRVMIYDHQHGNERSGITDGDEELPQRLRAIGNQSFTATQRTKTGVVSFAGNEHSLHSKTRT